NVWFTGNAGTGVGGFQKFDGERWTGFNDFTYSLGYPFPYQADNTQAIYSRPSNDDVVFNPTFHGLHAWDGNNYMALEDLMTDSKGFTEDSQGRLWSLGEYYNVRYYDESVPEWITVPIVGWGSKIIKDPTLPGTIWATTDYEILRTDGNISFSRSISDFPGAGANFTGIAIEPNGFVWVGTWSQFTSTGSTLIRLDPNTGLYQTWSYDEGWPFPGEHVRPMAITPDGRLWMQYDSEYPSNDAGLCWYDGENVGIFQASPGGIPQWGGLPNSTIKDIEVKELSNGYELWMSCLGRGIAVLEVITEPLAISEPTPSNSEISLIGYPNPATNKVTFDFNIDAQGFNNLAIYDIYGKKIKDIISETLVKGSHTAEWNLTTHDGKKVGTGVYFAILSNEKNSKSIKIIVR
ncbi:MAG: T9SS type A sorting domain-containing protein, partial [Bacteroidales bacterium]|nr:T9SS type A sorting domain-containing protein [Bacteroidales bacterium]